MSETGKKGDAKPYYNNYGKGNITQTDFDLWVAKNELKKYEEERREKKEIERLQIQAKYFSSSIIEAGVAGGNAGGAAKCGHAHGESAVPSSVAALEAKITSYGEATVKANGHILDRLSALEIGQKQMCTQMDSSIAHQNQGNELLAAMLKEMKANNNNANASSAQPAAAVGGAVAVGGMAAGGIAAGVAGAAGAVAGFPQIIYGNGAAAREIDWQQLDGKVTDVTALAGKFSNPQLQALGVTANSSRNQFINALCTRDQHDNWTLTAAELRAIWDTLSNAEKERGRRVLAANVNVPHYTCAPLHGAALVASQTAV